MAVDHVLVDSAEPFERGRQRGVQVAAHLRWTWPLYEQLFAITARDTGRPAVDVRSLAAECLDAVRSWSPDTARELEGVASGAGVDVSTVMALNARTEVFARARGTGPTECSTLVQLEGPAGTALGAQTWDWHDELSGGWHTQTVRGHPRTFVGLAEHGMLAKIGVNDSGLGVMFNLLRHESDSASSSDSRRQQAGGVPVHLVAHEVLTQATTVGEALELARSAPVLGSTVLTVLTPDAAACLELSPDGVGVVEPAGGWLVHTNHFLDPALATGERVTDDVTTTFERADLLRSRVKKVDERLGEERLVRLLDAHDGDGVSVCRHPLADAQLGYRTATLATVGIDPAQRVAHISAGGPCRRAGVTELIASP
jgi:isopenicillin-N N-acyltransferase-like protein